MKVGVIGLGNIAQKAYLPVITSKEEIEPVFCTRNRETLKRLSGLYRISDTAESLEELIDTGIEAAFIHTATDAHVEAAKRLMDHNIHVYVDKPVSYFFKDVRELFALSREKKCILMTGFNRRYAPMYSDLRGKATPDILIMQKNRVHLPDTVRRLIFDDFIHVVDTLRFLMPSEVEEIDISSLQKGGKLYNVAVILKGKNCTGIGIMNRDSGAVEEKLEFMSHGKKWVVNDLNETHYSSDGEEKTIRFNDWEPVLKRRGFYQIIEHFINAVKQNGVPDASVEDSLATHEICEKIVCELENVNSQLK